MKLLPILLLVMPMAAGVALALRLRLWQEWVITVAAGSVLGTAATVTGLYGLSLLLPQTRTELWLVVTSLGLLAPGLLVRGRQWRRVRELVLDRQGAFLGLLLLMLAVLIVPTLLTVDHGRLSTGVINAWGDLGWHVASITMLAEGQTFPPPDPIFAGHPMFYPFLINFFSASLVRSGLALPLSVVLPALLLIPLLLVLLYCLVREVTSSRGAGVVAVALLALGGGTLGWLRLGRDYIASAKTLTEFMTHLPQDYSGHSADAHGWQFLNPVISLLLPQRSFLFGLPVVVLIILLLFTGHRDSRRAPYLWAGILSGMLPLLHAHSVLALLPVVFGLFLVRPEWRWGWYVVPAVVLGVPEILYYRLAGVSTQSFWRWAPGWVVGNENLIWFWFKNTGLVLPAAIAGLFLPAPRLLKVLAIAGLVIFLAANLWLFAPWAWDNIKLLIFWYVFSLPLIGWVVMLAWRRYAWCRIVLVPALSVHLIAGLLDVGKLALPGAQLLEEWNVEAQEIAAEIKGVTRPNEIVVTAPYHNNPVALAGRVIYLGFAGHVWTHGGSPWTRVRAIKSFFEGGIEQLPDVHPQYVLIGPVERQQFPRLVIRPNWQLVTQTENYQLYRLPSP